MHQLFTCHKEGPPGKRAVSVEEKGVQMQQHSQNFVYRLLAGSNNEIQVQFIVTPSKPGHTSSTTAQAYGGPQSITLVPPTVENSRREQREPCRAST